MVSNSTVSYRKIVGERKHQFMQQTSLLSYFKKLPQPHQLLAATTLTSQQPSASRQEPSAAKRSQLAEGSGDSLFSAIKGFLVKAYPFFRHNVIAHLIDYSLV